MGKRKIGEIYNKPIVEGDINLKTPNEIHKSELSGGGGNSSGEVKEWYYRLNIQKAIEDGMDDTSISLLFGLFTFYITKIYYHDDYHSQKYSEVPQTNNVDNLKNSIAARLTNHPMYFTQNDNEYNYPAYVYGNYYSRIIGMLSSLGSTPPIEEIKNMVASYITEISKEEYEALIEWPIIILGKE